MISFPWNPCAHRGATGFARCWCRHPERTVERPNREHCAACPLVAPQLPHLDLDLSNVAVLTTHFNPLGYERLDRNHRDWVEEFPDIELRVLELRYDDEPNRLGGIAIPAQARHVFTAARLQHTLWQKESLLNWGLRHLSPRYEYVAWIDADLFADWRRVLSHGVQRLQSGARLVQLCEQINHLNQQGQFTVAKPGAIANLRQGLVGGNPGSAWLARLEDVQSRGLFPLAIVGGGDQLTLSGMLGRPAPSWFGDMQPDLQTAWRYWSSRYAFTGRDLDYVPVQLVHRWHGEQVDRRYADRWQRLLDFQPHMVQQEGPLLAWTATAPESLRVAVAEYFRERREDGRGTCRHRGEIVDRIRSGCPSCNGQPIYACDVHQLAVETQYLREEVRGARSCERCREYES